MFTVLLCSHSHTIMKIVLKSAGFLQNCLTPFSAILPVKLFRLSLQFSGKRGIWGHCFEEKVFMYQVF